MSSQGHKQYVDQIVRQNVHPTLQGRGFVRRGRTWNRDIGWCVDVIDVQVGQWSETEGGDFTVNLGVHIPSAYEVFWGQGPPAFAGEARSVVRLRLGALTDDGILAEDGLRGGVEDQWWDFDASTDLASLGYEIASLIVERALPFFERLHSMRAVQSFLSQHGEQQISVPYAFTYLAIIKAKAGEHTEAERLLAEVDGISPSWRAVTSKVADRLGLLRY